MYIRFKLEFKRISSKSQNYETIFSVEIGQSFFLNIRFKNATQHSS